MGKKSKRQRQRPRGSGQTAGLSRREAKMFAQVNSVWATANNRHKIGDYRSGVLHFTEAIKIVSTQSNGSDHQELLASLLHDRAGGLLSIDAAEAAIDDCKRALGLVSPTGTPSPQFTIGHSCGPVLVSNLYIRMTRALLHAGKAEEAEKAVQSANSISVETLDVCRQLHTGGELEHDETILAEIVSDVELEIAMVSNFQNVMARIAAYELPSLHVQSGDTQFADPETAKAALCDVDEALRAAPVCLELHETKIALLIGLRRWREVAGHCERLAVMYVQCDGTFKGDLEARNPFPDIPPAKSLRADFFGDPQEEDFQTKDLAAAELQLDAKAAAEAALRLSHSIVPFYLRSLRLEERYATAEAAIDALDQFVKSKVNTAAFTDLSADFAWLSREASMLSRTKTSREMGDALFRSGDFSLADSQYSSCMKIDSEGQEADFAGGSGGRLHAVLHCNRAACLMAVKKFDEALQECTAALGIHSRYMKAMLRRARCYSRLHRYEEAVNHYTMLLDLVDDAKREPSPALLTPSECDGPRDVSDTDAELVKQELEGAKDLLSRHQTNSGGLDTVRAQADRLKETFMRLSEDSQKKWDSQRIQVMQRYVELMRDILKKDLEFLLNYSFKEDRSFLKAIYRKEGELVYFRASVVFLLGRMHKANFESEDASQCWKLAIKMCAQASGQEKQHAYLQTTVGLLLDRVTEDCLFELQQCRASVASMKFQDGTIRPVVILGGDQQCDTCGKLEEDVRVGSLACCGRCQLTYYCSRDCQKKGWKECDHKKLCRKKGEVRVSDTAWFTGLGENFPRGRLVYVVARVDKTDKWLVADALGENKTFVLTKNLRRVRPILWYMDKSRCAVALKLQVLKDIKRRCAVS